MNAVRGRCVGKFDIAVPSGTEITHDVSGIARISNFIWSSYDGDLRISKVSIDGITHIVEGVSEAGNYWLNVDRPWLDNRDVLKPCRISYRVDSNDLQSLTHFFVATLTPVDEDEPSDPTTFDWPDR